MLFRSVFGSLLLAVSILFLLSTPAAAQGTIAGLVTDATGSVLPGVTVEAASPALIEKARSIVTDAQGLYQIVELRPGTYAVTFTLPGFSTLRREGLELTTGFTATVNAELKVGGLEETITVTGEAPVVDRPRDGGGRGASSHARRRRTCPWRHLWPRASAREHPATSSARDRRVPDRPAGRASGDV